MIVKEVAYFGKVASSIFCQPLFGDSGAFEKVAGAPPFADWATGDTLRKFISGISVDDRKHNQYVLVNALGAGEYFGSNINSDYFPWDALCHEGDDWGYQTFEKFGHAFQHHINKDPNKAFGVPELAVLNMPMKRVELIVKLNRDKAKSEGADSIITRIDKGEFPDVSMGCKVPYDVCSICGNKSKTRDDYCVHMRPPEELRAMYGPNKILPDGRKIYVVNTQPKFFDISFVFIGADKTAKVMAKLASKGDHVCLGDVCTIGSVHSDNQTKTASSSTPAPSKEKVASEKAKKAGSCGCGGSCCQEDPLAEAFGVKTATQNKVSEIIKNVPVSEASRVANSEVDFSDSAIKSMSRQDLGTTLSTAGMLGIALKPKEFQTIVLIKMGEADMAWDLWNRNEVFRQVDEIDSSLEISKDKFDPKLASRFTTACSIDERSAFGLPFIKRAARNTMQNTLPTQETIEHAVLDKISAAYNGYRRSLLTKLSEAVEVIQSDPRLREIFVGSPFGLVLSKTAGAPIVTLDSVAYLMGAHFSDKSLLCNNEVAEEVAEMNLV